METHTMAETKEKAEEIVEEFSDHLDLTVDQVQERFDELVNEYQVPVSEATQSIRNSYLSEAGIDNTGSNPTESDEILVGEIDEGDEWVEATVKVTELWEPKSDAVAQVGLVGDESGTTRFVSFTTSDLPKLEEGKSYNLKNVVTDEYQGEYSIQLNKTTEITELDEEVEVGENVVTIEGALVDIQSGSGLIKRCPEEGCTRVLNNGRCTVHGEVEGEFDLRIKAVIDDGDEIHEVVFKREATESLTGMSMDEAKQMAMDALEREVVENEFKEMLIGNYYRVTGQVISRYMLGDEHEKMGAPDETHTSDLISRAEAI